MLTLLLSWKRKAKNNTPTFDKINHDELCLKTETGQTVVLETLSYQS